MPRRLTQAEREERGRLLLAQREVGDYARGARVLEGVATIPWIEIALMMGTTQQNLHHYMNGERLWPVGAGEFRSEMQRAIERLTERYTAGVAGQ